LQRSQAPSFSFATTALAATSTDSPQSVTLQNIGNQSLSAVTPGLSIGANSFVQVAGSGTPADCSSTFSLSAGASCNLSIAFIPQATGSIVSADTLTDNALNATAATQNIALQGTGTKDSQSISFGALSNLALGTAPFLVSATASSGLAVSFASTTSAVCTVSGATVTLGTLGTCTIQATQGGNGTYTAATLVSQSFMVTPDSQTVSFGALSNQVFGTAPFTLSATASSGLAVSFASTTTPECTVAGATVTLAEVGTCTIQATQAGNATYAAATPVNQSFQVTPASQTITFGALSNQAIGTAPFTVSATASSGLAVSFASTTSAVCTVSGATVTLAAVGTCTIQATQAGNINYAAAVSVNQSFQVTQGSQAITFGALSSQTLGSAPFTVSATASSGLAVSFTSTTSAVCTVSGATVTLVALGTCTIQATQAGNATYAAAVAVSQSFQVSAAEFTLSSTPTTMTIPAGQTGTFTLTATPQGSFGSPISFVCNGLPAMANCAFSPATITPDTKPASTTLTITTTARTTALLVPPLNRRSTPLPLYAVWLAVPGILVGMATRKRRKLASYCLLFLVAGGCLLQVACGGGSGSTSTGTGGTPAGNYTVTVTGGAAGSTQQALTVTLTVQ
jgi:hypothetical protein